MPVFRRFPPVTASYHSTFSLTLKLTTPEEQIVLKLNKAKIETLESQKQELEDSMNSSRHQEYVRKEMDKIRAEGWKEESTTDTHKIIKEAE